MGMGISGGEEGARKGPSLMPGGEPGAYELMEPIITKCAAQVDDGPCTFGQGCLAVHRGRASSKQQCWWGGCLPSPGSSAESPPSPQDFLWGQRNMLVAVQKYETGNSQRVFPSNSCVVPSNVPLTATLGRWAAGTT